MATELVVKVPGKVMLHGEYYVLTTGARALAFAIDSYLEVYARYGTPQRQSLTLHSNLWDTAQQIDINTDRADMLIDTVCELMPPGEHRVEEIRVTSQLDPKHGFGSSSAIRMALAFIAFLQQRATNLIIPQNKRWQLAGEAFELQKSYQGLASGYDIATQFVGGVVNYSSAGQEWPCLTSAKPLLADENRDPCYNLSKIVHLFVGGQGADTGTVVRDTQDWIDSQGHVPMVMMTDILQLAFMETLRDLDNLPQLIEAMANWRKWFSESPHFPRHIETALRSVCGRDHKWSWKTSGAGGEDALIVVGYREDIAGVYARLAEQGWQAFDYRVAEHGLQLRRV